MDTIRVSFFVTFRYILTTLFILAMLILIIVGFVAFPIWILIGVSLPILLVLKVSEPTYYYLHKIDIEKIMAKTHEIIEGDDDE